MTEENEKETLKLLFRGSGTKIVDRTLSVTHEMPEVSVEANSVEEGYEIARFKYHDIGYNIVHSLQCVNGSRIKQSNLFCRKQDVD